MTRISERELILPALMVIRDRPGISTSQLIDALTGLLRPTGEDEEILAGRSDTRFSQKVRNLVSHSTLSGPGLTEYTHDGQNGYHRITTAGERYLAGFDGALDYIVDAGLDYARTGEGLTVVADAQAVGQVIEPLPDGLVISEGAARRVSRRVIEHSRVLRQAAVESYAKAGPIRCAACGFNFEAIYGSIGEGYIEMHHVSPLFLHEGQPVDTALPEAIRRPCSPMFQLPPDGSHPSARTLHT